MGEEDLELLKGCLAVVRPSEGNGATRHLGEGLSNIGEIGTKSPVVPDHSQQPQQRLPGS